MNWQWSWSFIFIFSLFKYCISSARKPWPKYPHLCAFSHNFACLLAVVQQFDLDPVGSLTVYVELTQNRQVRNIGLIDWWPVVWIWLIDGQPFKSMCSLGTDWCWWARRERRGPGAGPPPSKRRLPRGGPCPRPPLPRDLKTQRLSPSSWSGSATRTGPCPPPAIPKENIVLLNVYRSYKSLKDESESSFKGSGFSSELRIRIRSDPYKFSGSGSRANPICLT